MKDILTFTVPAGQTTLAAEAGIAVAAEWREHLEEFRGLDDFGDPLGDERVGNQVAFWDSKGDLLRHLNCLSVVVNQLLEAGVNFDIDVELPASGAVVFAEQMTRLAMEGMKAATGYSPIEASTVTRYADIVSYWAPEALRLEEAGVALRRPLDGLGVAA